MIEYEYDSLTQEAASADFDLVNPQANFDELGIGLHV